MKKTIYFLGIIICTILLVGCTENKQLKTQYNFNEQGYLDDIEIKIIKATLADEQLELTVEITNRQNNTITISADNNFRLYDINQVQIPNQYINHNNIIKKDQTITYTLKYNVSPKETYDILFYSGIVENNIKFSITSKNIEKMK